MRSFQRSQRAIEVLLNVIEEEMDWAPSLTSLRLLVPPLRLAAAALWRVVEEQKVEEFGKVEELVSVVTRLVPELLSRRQRATLIVGLRTKMILEMCRGELPADLHTVKSHIHHIRATDLLKAGDSEMEDLQERVLKMVLALLEDSVRRRHFFQEVFPVQYGPDFDKALQVLVGFFLSRLEQLLPVPSFKQLSVLLRCHSEELDVCVDSVCDAQNFLSLLHTDVCGALEENVLPEVVEDRIRSSLSLPLPEDVYQQVSGGWMLTSSKPETVRGEARDSASDSSEDMGREKEMSRGTPPETSSAAQPDAAEPPPPDAPARTGFHYAGRTVHRCQRCSKFFRFRSDLLKHQDSHHGASHGTAALRVFQCVKCPAHFRSLGNLYRHNRAHKEKSTHKCPECGRLFSSPSRLVNHRRAHRRPAVRRSYACEQCHSSFGSYRASLVHRKVHGPKDARPAKPEQPPGKCRFCHLTFGVDSELRSHLKTHAEFRPYICDQCGKCFSANGSLLAHLSNHTGEKPLLCSQCGKRFYSKIQLKSHMRCHSGERPHVCPYCQKHFSLSGNLKIHVRIHTGEKPYVCQQCGKGFVSAGCLQVHLRSHTGEKPYQCKVCGKKFVVSSHLTAHMCFHTGERPHGCLQCGKRFVRRYDLSKHMYTHIGKRPFPCPACPKAYTCRTHLNRHMKSHSA